MAIDSSKHDAADQYLQLFADDRPMRAALLACSAALWLDDEVALQMIHLLLPENGQGPELLWRLKRLGCVWQKWDGSWRLAEDVRVALSERLDEELPPERVIEMRDRLASHADKRVSGFSSDGQITSYRTREALLEAAYQKTLIPNRTDQAAQGFAGLWRGARPAAREATASAADHLAGEILRRVESIPPELLFLRGMAARSRGDSKRAEQCFREVWKQGRPGEIFSTAAHLFGIMVRDQEIAERALRDSLEWCGTDYDPGKVWHSLANLLSRQSRRWRESEESYLKALQLLQAPEDRGQVWHSLGKNLLSQQRPRWQEAEEAFRKSIQLLHAPDDRGQVWHSLGNLLSQQRPRWQETEEAFRESIQLLHAPGDQAQVYASWAGAIIKRQDFPSYSKAEEYARYSLSLNPRVPRHRSTVYGLLARICAASGRYPEAIEALAAAIEADRELGNTRLLRDRLTELGRLRRRLQDAQHD